MNKLTKLIFVMSALSLFSCSPKEKVDLVILNATAYTVDQDFSIVEAVAVKDGKIVALGSSSEISDRYSSSCIIDLDKKALYPGFIDAHCHFYSYGLGLLQHADLTGTESFEKVLEIMENHRHKFPSIQWLQGRGWDQNLWIDKTFPDNDELNKLFPENPVILTRIDGHAALVNQKALELAGIDAATKISGGEVALKNGQPTGMLIDNAIGLVTRVIPKPDATMISEALLTAQHNCFAAGLTGVHEAGLTKEIIKIIDSLQKAGLLKMRVYAMLSPTQETLDAYFKNGITKNENLNIGSIKLYADGALGSRGAKLIDDYSDNSGNSGLLVENPETLKKYCQMAYDNGFQVCTHAIGDSANRLMLTIYGDILKNKNDLRWRIEHAQVVAPSDFDLFGKYSVIPSVQPTHATSDMFWAGDRLGAERIKGAYAYNDLLRQNGWMPLGTDFPIENINPIHTFYASVVRKNLDGKPETGFQMENAISREEALRGMTLWAAKAAFEENEKGSISVGKLADFVILDKDIMTIAENEIPNVKVLMTIVSGETVFLSEQ